MAAMETMPGTEPAMNQLAQVMGKPFWVAIWAAFATLFRAQRRLKLRIELNGTRILDGDLSKVTEFKDNQDHPGRLRTSGHFGFAGHNDPVAFRNVSIKEL